MVQGNKALDYSSLKLNALYKRFQDTMLDMASPFGPSFLIHQRCWPCLWPSTGPFPVTCQFQDRVTVSSSSAEAPWSSCLFVPYISVRVVAEVHQSSTSVRANRLSLSWSLVPTPLTWEHVGGLTLLWVLVVVLAGLWKSPIFSPRRLSPGPQEVSGYSPSSLWGTLVRENLQSLFTKGALEPASS